MRLGDDYIKALADAFPYATHLNEVTLSHNRLTSKGITSVLDGLRINKVLLKKMRTLNLSFNKLSANAVDTLCDLFDDQYSELQEINLEANAIGDTKIIKICETISKSLIDKVTNLNLGQNMITDKACTNIAALVRDCLNLEILIIYWNHIRNYGASLIMSEIKYHVGMKVFDISWNSIGENLTHEPSLSEIIKSENVLDVEGRTFMNVSISDMRKTMFINMDSKPKTREKIISPFIKELSSLFNNLNSKMIHLDISHNNIAFSDSKYISILTYK